MFDPLPGVQIVFRRPSAESETFEQWIEQYQEDAPRSPAPDFIRNHYASVAEFKWWKLHHPGDGSITVMRRHAPAIIGTVAVLTGNPIMLFAALGMEIEKRRHNV